MVVNGITYKSTTQIDGTTAVDATIALNKQAAVLSDIE